MSYQTLTYSETSKGFPSFYSYNPESMLGMNNYFYSFKGGDLWRHNSTTTAYANFYGNQYAASISSVFNDSPLQAKVFKTLELHSDTAWTANPVVSNAPLTGKQVGGEITDTLFEQKEGAWFSYIRNNATPANNDIPLNQLALRSVKGIGTPNAIVGANTNACTLTFASDFSSTMSVGDFLYQNSQNIGKITDINNVDNIVTFDNDTAAFPSLSTAQNLVYTIYVQSSSVESHGIVGQYLEFTLSITSGVASELFSVKSDVMKSYP